MFVFLIIFTNPYKEPPSHLPRKILESEPLPSSNLANYPRLRDKLYKIVDRLPGYNIGVQSVQEDKPVRKWSDEAKWRNRRKRLEARIHKEFSIPQLYEMELERRLKLKPEYYGLTPDLNPIDKSQGNDI